VGKQLFLLPKICKEKGSVSDPDPHWFASNTFFNYLNIFILDYEMPRKSVTKLFQKPKVVLKVK
jgi:hypothetical protein